jgi:hypothetical protein
MGLVEAALEIAGFLNKQRVPYAILGGFAVQYHGQPRQTSDVDLVVLVPDVKLDGFMDGLIKAFPSRIRDAKAFALKNRVLLLTAEDGTPIDLSFGIPGYEEEAMKRVVRLSIPGKGFLRLLGAEDLIIHKCVAGRARDLEDIESIIIRRKGKLDLGYIRRWLGEFAPLVDEHDVQSAFEQSFKRAKKALAVVRR